jgi:hypothetical protein
MIPGYQLLHRIAKFLDGKEIKFKDLGTWRLIHKISGKICQENYSLPFEAVTVYICEKMAGKDAGQRAVMKIRTEYVRHIERNYGDPTDRFRIPGTDFSHSRDPWPVSKGLNPVTRQEINYLETLTKLGCTSTPRLLGLKDDDTQGKNMWLPGGYIVYILMQLVPGVSLEDFWELPRDERDQARKAFRTALE